MIRLTFVKVLCVFVVMLFVGITSFVMLFPKPEKLSDKQVGVTSPAKSQDDTPKIHASSQDDTPDLEDTTPEIGTILPGASDAEMNAYLAKLEDTEITEDMLDTTDPYFIEITKMYTLIAAGKHPDYPPPPSRKDFSSKHDYLKADLEYYKKKVLEAEGTKYQEDFESTVSTIEKNIQREKAWIEHKERRRESDAEMEARRIEINVSLARLMSQSSDEDWELYIEQVVSSIPPHIQQAVFDDLLSEQQASESSGLPVLSDAPIPPVESSKSVSSSPVVDPDLPVEVKQLMEQVGSWDKTLIKDFPDIFAYPDVKSRDAFSQSLPSEGSRQYFRERQTALHKEYAALLQTQLKGMPKQKREQAISTARESLSRDWDSDFAESVIRQLERDLE